MLMICLPLHSPASACPLSHFPSLKLPFVPSFSDAGHFIFRRRRPEILPAFLCSRVVLKSLGYFSALVFLSVHLEGIKTRPFLAMAEVAGEGLKEKCVEEREQDHHQEEKETEVVKEEMKPWEQHSAVISIPRFDYNAPSSLLRYSHSGFLITCPIKREKSATKEAISILEKYIQANHSVSPEGSDASENVKRRKLSLVNGEKDESPLSTEANCPVKQSPSLFLVKVTRSGLVVFSFPKDSPLDPVGIVSHVNQSVESGALKRPLWCHRIFPIQATCQLTEEEVSATVSKLLLKFVDGKRNDLSGPLKFAIGYNRRGIEDTEMKVVKGNSGDPSLSWPMLDRNKCFSIVASAVKEAVSDSIVDLKFPELCILIELLPLSGVPNGSLVTAVSLLPGDLVTTKPRLCVKSLVSSSKAQ